MDRTLANLYFVESFVYDCLIFSSSFERHMEHIEAVLRRLKEARIQLRLEKCHFGYSQVDFLGHSISREESQPLQSSAEALAQFPRPTSVKQLQGFLGSVNFYLAYIPKIAHIAQPLYALTRKGVRWVWSEACELAFNELRDKLISEPVKLAFPRWGEVIYIETDANRKGVAAVLSQKDQTTGILQPISYFSTALSASQENYSAGQLEAWALVAASRKFELYLRTAPQVHLITDHCPLQWLRNQNDPRHTYSRWLMELEEIPYSISFRPGSSNILPDYLSRASGLTMDPAVIEERRFEDRIFETSGEREPLRRDASSMQSWTTKIAQEQENDQVIRDAK